jgi:hypothetical protein
MFGNGNRIQSGLEIFGSDTDAKEVVMGLYIFVEFEFHERNTLAVRNKYAMIQYFTSNYK